MDIKLPDARLAFPVLFTAKPFQGDNSKPPEFSASFLLDPSNKQHAAVIKEIEKAEREVATAKWGADKVEAILTSLKANDRLAHHDGDKKAEYDGFPGTVFVSCRSKVRPLLIDRQKNPVTEADGIIYGGCYVNAKVSLWAQDNSFGKRINAQVTGVQFNRAGDAFGGGGKSASADEFDDLGVDESEGDDLTS